MSIAAIFPGDYETSRLSASRALSSVCGVFQNPLQSLARLGKSSRTEWMFHLLGCRFEFNSVTAIGVETGAPFRGRIEKTEASD